MNIKLPMKIVLGIVAIFVVIAFTQMNIVTEEKEDVLVQKPEDIVTLASHTNDLSNFTSTIKMTDFVDSLRQGGPYTVFAPHNDAFAQLPDGMYADIMSTENRDQLQNIFQYHVVRGIIEAEDLEDGQMLSTLQGDSLQISIRNDSTMIGGVKLVRTDLPASNGIIHVTDGVILPAQNQNESPAAP